MTLDPSDVQSALCAKGFAQDDSHHKMFWFYLDGKKTSIRTRISHGARELDKFLIGQMAKQIRLKKGEFVEFVVCTLSAEEYAAKMREALNLPLE